MRYNVKNRYIERKERKDLTTPHNNPMGVETSILPILQMRKLVPAKNMFTDSLIHS